MKTPSNEQKMNAIGHFSFRGRLISSDPYGNGHINETYLLIFGSGDSHPERAILQRMNTEIFKHPAELMENIGNVTAFLRKKIIADGGDPERETLNVVRTVDGLPYYADEDGNYWRAYRCIEDTVEFNAIKNPHSFYDSGVAFGHFQYLLSDYPAKTLHETIKGFHDTLRRYADFEASIRRDAFGKAQGVQKEIEAILSRRYLAECFAEHLSKGDVPVRVTHNDTKLNNILFDKKTSKPICIIDLDTVMPGLAMNDYGDSIRFGASTGAEDERDLNLVEMSFPLFSGYTEAFIKGCAGKLTENEILLLPRGAQIMTYECGMRFLADYLDGDVYFKTNYPGHNLDRARTQIKLVEDMEAKYDKMMSEVAKYLK